MKWNPPGHSKRQGRPTQTWRRTVEKEMNTIGQSWNTIATLAKNKTRHKAAILTLCLQEDQGISEISQGGLQTKTNKECGVGIDRTIHCKHSITKWQQRLTWKIIKIPFFFRCM